MASMVSRINLTLMLLVGAFVQNRDASSVDRKFKCQLVWAYLSGEVVKDSLASAEAFRVKVNGSRDDLRIQEMRFIPFDFVVEKDTCNSKFSYALLKFNLVSMVTHKGCTEVLLIDSLFQISDMIKLDRYKIQNGTKVFVSEAWVVGDSVRIDNYRKKDQDASMHPYMTKVKESIYRSVDRSILKFKK